MVIIMIGGGVRNRNGCIEGGGRAKCRVRVGMVASEGYSEKRGSYSIKKEEISGRGPMPLREREGCNARRGDKWCSVGGGRDERRLMG